MNKKVRLTSKLHKLIPELRKQIVDTINSTPIYVVSKYPNDDGSIIDGSILSSISEAFILNDDVYLHINENENFTTGERGFNPVFIDDKLVAIKYSSLV